MQGFGGLCHEGLLYSVQLGTLRCMWIVLWTNECMANVCQQVVQHCVEECGRIVEIPNYGARQLLDKMGLSNHTKLFAKVLWEAAHCETNLVN